MKNEIMLKTKRLLLKPMPIEKPKTSWMTVYMCFGISIGMALGSLMGNVFIGMCYGVAAGILPVLLDVPEGEEIPACVVEDPVQHHPDAPAVAGRHKILEILIGAQAAVQLPVVRGVVAVGLGFKQRPDVQGIAAQLCHVIDPGKQCSQPGLGRAVVIVHGSPG